MNITCHGKATDASCHRCLYFARGFVVTQDNYVAFFCEDCIAQIQLQLDYRKRPSKEGHRQDASKESEVAMMTSSSPRVLAITDKR